MAPTVPEAATPGPMPAVSCAVPAQPGVEPPAGCVAYDPEAGMRSNDSFRDRMDISAEARAAGDRLLDPVRQALEGVRAAGAPVTEDAVRSALGAAGLAPDGVQTREDNGSVLFGAAFASAADGVASCVYGSVDAEAVAVDVGGLIMDGGCLPAQ